MQETDELYGAVARALEQNDEVGLRAILTDRITEFPEDIRERIMFFFFEEALQKTAVEDSLNAIAEQAIRRMELLRQGERIVQDKIDTKKLESQI